MWYGVLGPLTVADDGRECTPSAPRLRTALALLLARPNEPVSADDLMEELWGERRPRSALNSLQVFVTRLRAALAPELGPQAPGQVLVTSAAGYQLRVEPDDVDMHHFERLADHGENALAAGDAAAAADTLREALGLWRGQPFADVATGTVLQTHALRIEERRNRAVEQRIEADLRLGRHAELIAELEALATTHPLREGLRAQLMLALYRSGRRAEALEEYRRLRDGLVDELAVEPAPGVQGLHRAILAGDPSLDAPSVPVAVDRGGGLASVCAQLPPDVSDFTGRQDDIKLVEAPLTAERDRDCTAVPVIAVAGEAGVGKTALSVHCAHRLRPYYPDGQLFLNLRGADEDPMDVGYALGRLLRGLGVDGSAIPETADERGELFRSRTADRRILLVLDNAGGEAQVRPLLPGGRGCGVLVTSRSRLSGLEGAIPVDLGMFSEDEAVELLRRVAGADRLASELGAAERISRLCGHLPLAVRVAGAKLAAKPHWSVAKLAERLADERRRLGELRVGDLDVRASIGLSYHGRAEDERRAFRALGLLGMPDFPSWPLAALLDTDLSAAEELVEGLVDAHLLQVAGRDGVDQVRYQFHDLVRAFAVERLDTEDERVGQAAAMRRVLGGYAGLARAADEKLRPGRRPLGREAARRWAPDPRLAALAAGNPAEWFTAERVNLILTIEHAHSAEHWPVVTALADCVVGFYEMRTHWDDWSYVAELARDASRSAGDPRAEAAALRAQGYLLWDQGRPQDAAPYYRESLARLRGAGDRHDRAHALLELGYAYLDMGRAEEMHRCLDECLPAFREFADLRGEAFVAYAQGRAYRDQGRPEAAARRFVRYLDLCRRLNDRANEAYALLYLGMARADQRRLDEAAGHIQACLPILRSLDDRRWEAVAHCTLGDVRRDQGRFGEARSWYAEALAIDRDLGSELSEAYTLRSLGDLCREQGHLATARDHVRQSLAIFDRLGYQRGMPLAQLALSDVARAEGNLKEAAAWAGRSHSLFRDSGQALGQARALVSLGEALTAMGRTAQARRRWEAALTIFEQVESPEADRVARLLRRATRTDRPS
ncbi:MAG: AfsR/SARP family transcriptional regulator [Micromonosporaceae bacterium]